MTVFTNGTTPVHHATITKVEAIAASLVAEYPALALVAAYDATDHVTHFSLTHREDTDADPVEVKQYEIKGVPSVGDLAADAEEMGFDPEAIEIETGPSGSVVAETYRKTYKEVSTTGRCNGDWLAEWFADQTVGADKKTNMDEVETIFEVNDLDMSAKWAKTKGSPGWQGRFRMNGRQVLEKLVAKRGWVKCAAGNQYDVPAEFLATLQAKHAKWLAKEAKREEQAEAIAKSLAEEAIAEAEAQG